jgi:pimeloyl-ACP methyl ester carboxylesterase
MLRRVMIWGVVLAAVLYAAVCVLLFFAQRSLVYFPQPNANREGMTRMRIDGPSGTADALARETPGQEAVLYFGGNGEDVSFDMPDLALVFPDRSIYLLNYPGYGGSPGKPSEDSILAAALALFDRVHATRPHIVVIGRSLGTGVAVHLAAERPVERLVLVTPFDTFADPAAAAYPWFPVRLLLRDKFDSRRYAPKVTAPTRIIVAADDELIPRASSERLRDRFPPGTAEYVVLPGVGHNSISLSPGYWRLLAAEPATRTTP